MTVSRASAAGLLVAMLLALAACGGDDGGDGGGRVGSTPQQSSPAEPGDVGADSSEGKRVFTSAGCSGCHTLADADAHSGHGPDLDQVRPDRETVAAKVRQGGGGLPSFDGKLDDSEIEAVAAYVAAVAGR